MKETSWPALTGWQKNQTQANQCWIAAETRESQSRIHIW